MFGKSKKQKQVVASKEIEHPSEVLEMFNRMNLFHQTAMLRSIARNLMVNIDGEVIMGHELNFDVYGAMIEATNDSDLGETADTELS